MSLRQIERSADWAIYKCSDTKEYQLKHISGDDSLTYHTDDLDDARDTMFFENHGFYRDDNAFE